MGANKYLDCPCCQSKDSVPIYNEDYMELTSDGRILHFAEGRCRVCGLHFSDQK